METEKEKFLRSFEKKLKDRLDKKTLNKLSKRDGDFEDLKSVDYEKFRLESLGGAMNFYEKYCNFCQKVLPAQPDKKSAQKLEKELFNAHLACTPMGVMSAAILTAIMVMIIGLFLIVLGIPTIGIGIILIGISVYFILQMIPQMFEKKLKSQANDEVIIAIFYIVAFMRFSSNFELATSFAANYLSGPLALDFKRILWELDNSKYPTIKAAFDHYLEAWRDENLEFLEAIYLIESSLYESEEMRRISLLDKSLDIILQGNYEKMLHFAQDLKGKVEIFNMMGVVLPILGLIILPLAASFGNPAGVWQVVFLLYNLIIPAGLTYFGFIIIFNRPSCVNSIKMPTKIKGLKNLQKYKLKLSKNKEIYISPKIPAIIIFTIFLILGLSPLILHKIGIDETLNNELTSSFGEDSPFGIFQEYKKIDKAGGYVYGPYGVYPGLLSLFIPLAFAFGIGYYLRYKYQNLVHLRDKTKNLERQFPSATFQLGNRINEGIAAELAFGAVAETMKGTEAGVFFSLIDGNIKFNGMSVEAAIFDDDKGAINNYPSDLVVSSMKILIRAIENGPDITAKTLVDLSRYLTEIHMSNERMLDLLGETLGSMKGQASFLAPLISGVVISIISLVTLILGKLSKATTQLAADNAAQNGVSDFLGESIPTYLFQGVVGIYIVILIIILMYVVTNLESGEDITNTRYQIGEKLISGLVKYSLIVAIGILGFSYIGSKILGNMI